MPICPMLSLATLTTVVGLAKLQNSFGMVVLQGSVLHLLKDNQIE